VFCLCRNISVTSAFFLWSIDGRPLAQVTVLSFAVSCENYIYIEPKLFQCTLGFIFIPVFVVIYLWICDVDFILESDKT
jgi:hypothetical protein